VLYESKLKARAYDRCTKNVENTDTNDDFSNKRRRQEKDHDTTTATERIERTHFQFSTEEWVKLVKDRPDVVRKSYHHEIEQLISHLFSQKMDLREARKRWYEIRNLDAPEHKNEFSYAENDWEKLKRWVERVTGQLGEITVLATLRRRNNDKDILVERLERGHQVDLLCNYEQCEIACALACGGPYSYDLTKLASDEYTLPRIMKDMLDDLELKFLHTGKVREVENVIGDDDDGFKTPPTTILSAKENEKLKLKDS
ncbi:17870_t:CDS:2, partial [Racocetra fulgida]